MYGVTFFHAYPFLRSRNEQNNSTYCFAYEPDEIKELYLKIIILDLVLFIQ